jgi:hypothetical protein
MGNFVSRLDSIPKKGHIYQIEDTAYTKENDYPSNIFGQGSKVKLIGSKVLLCSNKNAPEIMVSIVQLQNGNLDVYPSYNLKFIN